MDVNYYIINNKVNQSKKGNIMASFAYIKELFEKNKQNITNVKKSYLYSHPLQEQEKMI